MSKMSLTEATMLALQGKLVEEKATTKKPTKRLKKENIDINVDDKTNVSVMNNETIVDTEEATIIVDKKENEFVPETSDGIVDDTTLPMEAPVDTVEVPVEGDETIIPEEVIDEPIVEPSEENAIDDDVDLPVVDDEEKEESKKIEAKERTTKDVYVVQGNYGQGWEDVFESEDRKDAKDRLKEYNENEKEYAHKLITRRVKKESKSTCEECGKEVCECDKKVENKKLQEKLGYEPGICPDCGSDDLSYEKPISYTDSIEYPFHCNNCGKDGAERYNLDFVESETNELEESKKITKREFKFESKKPQDVIADDIYDCADTIAKEIEKIGCMNFQDIQDRVLEILDLSFDDNEDNDNDIYDIFTDVYQTLNYLGIANNWGDGDFYTEEYAEKHPEIKEESKEIKQENVNVEISDDGKEIEVTTDDGEEVEVKNETPDDVEEIEIEDETTDDSEEVEIEDELDESKKLNEDYSAAPFRDLMYDCMRDDIEPGDVMADRMLSAWSDDDCKWYCETYELVTPYKDFSDENEYYKDVYGNIRDISGQVVGEDDEDLEEAKHRKVESIKMIEARNKKKFETVKRNIVKPNTKKVENKVTTKSIKGVNEALTKILKVEKVENAKIEEVNGKILLKAKVLNENKVKGICFEMKEIANTDKFTRYSLQEIKSLKIENKLNETKYTMLVNKKDNMLECRYIIKK